nr:hypothetical protein [Kibdelosporangium sp. MJ126-NF4]CTQ98173.1 hypothetical protein [Kibdelosporangium sp. MJ126-NF4]
MSPLRVPTRLPGAPMDTLRQRRVKTGSCRVRTIAERFARALRHTSMDGSRRTTHHACTCWKARSLGCGRSAHA